MTRPALFLPPQPPKRRPPQGLGNPAGCAGRPAQLPSFAASHFGKCPAGSLGKHLAPGAAGRTEKCPFPACGAAGRNHPPRDAGFPWFPAGRRITQCHNHERNGFMRKEIYKVKNPKRIVFGDPLYFEEFKGASLNASRWTTGPQNISMPPGLCWRKNPMRNYPNT